MEVANRRPIKTRSAPWVAPVARAVAGVGFSPNGVSVMGVVISLIGCAGLVWSRDQSVQFRIAAFALAAVCIQLRLLCNMLDGMIAVELGLKSKVGDLFNEVPDRIEDVAFLLGVGYATGTNIGITLGWTASILAVTTAYVRLLGGSLGFKQDFCGPFAKPQRMFFLTVTCLGAAIEIFIGTSHVVVPIGLGLIAVGTAVTVVRRLGRIGRAMKAR